jgi:hypothetical protein
MTLNDIDGIRETVDGYFSGLRNRNLEHLLATWHPEARISYIYSGKMFSASCSFWESWCQQQAEPNEPVTCKMLSIDHTGTVAVAKVEVIMENSQSISKYTDYLTLMKFSNEKWLIVNKSYHAERAQKHRGEKHQSSTVSEWSCPV